MLIFDIDGVVADIHLFCLQNIAEKAGCRIEDVKSGTHNLKVPGDTLTDIEIFELAVSATTKYCHEIKPHEGAISFLDSYRWYIKDSVRFLTARPSNNAEVVEATYRWMDEHEQFPYFIHFSDNKIDFLRKNPQFTGIVEDRLRTANQLDFLDKVFLVNRQWNIGREAAPHVIRIDTLSDIWRYIR